MRRFILLILLSITSVVMLLSACGSDDNNEFNQKGHDVNEISYDANRKILVAYFSETGNTENLAQQIASATGANLFRIKAKEPYAANPYDDSDRITKRVLQQLAPGCCRLAKQCGELRRDIYRFAYMVAQPRYGGMHIP